MKTVAALCYPNCQILDVTGPMQVFASANKFLEFDAYQLQILGLTNQPVRTNSGMRMVPDCVYDESSNLDTLILAGGFGVMDVIQDKALIRWVKSQADSVKRIASVCSAAYMLAEAGLLEGKRATTHWYAAKKLAETYGNVEVEEDAIWIKQGNLYTSAGVTAGIDLALALVEEDYGHAIAMEIARELVVFMKRPGGQAQYSKQLQAQQKATGVVAKALSYIEQNITDDLSLPELAEYCHVSERHLFRLFKQSCGESPASYVESSRLDLAQQLLTEDKLNHQQVADRSGFGSADSMRRVFMRRLGITPSEFKQRFSSSRPGVS